MNEKFIKLAEEKNLVDHIKHIKDEMRKGYETEFASLSLPSDNQMIQSVIALGNLKKKHDLALVIVVGIGGSSLGAKAIYQALKGSFFYTETDVPHLYFLETIDRDYQQGIYNLIESALKNGRQVLINVISKSGSTLETKVNFEYLLELLKHYRPDTYAEFVVVTSDTNSSLHIRAQKEQFAFLPIPSLVGGRYSVFSPVGLFPLYLVGIDILRLIVGARKSLEDCFALDLDVNSAAHGALFAYFNYKNGAFVNDLFFFSIDLEGVGKWCRQLMAESLGKEFDRQGKKVDITILPTVSMGTNDLHSMVQLYLSSSALSCTTFIGVDSVEENADMMNVFLQGTSAAYEKNNRISFKYMLPEKNEYYLGLFLQLKMVETMFLGFLLNVNPFDQPKVEDYKKEVKRILDILDQE